MAFSSRFFSSSSFLVSSSLFLIFILFLLFSTPTGFHHQFTDPGIHEGFKVLHMVFTFAVFFPSLGWSPTGFPRPGPSTSRSREEEGQFPLKLSESMPTVASAAQRAGILPART